MFSLITDIGSTTTKSYLCDKSGKVLSIAKVPTTVEKPFEDVSIGFFNALKEIEKSKNIILFSDGKFSPAVDVYFTSSAGGGLQVTVVGLTELYSAKIGTKAALGSGAIISNIICGGDNRSEQKKIAELKKSSPDLILFAGGADSEFISIVCRMAKFIEEADVKNKFKKSNTPIIFSGNIYAIPDVKKILKNYPLFIEENICNNFKYRGENLQKRVLEIFQKHVMHDAPGYPKIVELTRNKILPTPIAVSKAMSLLGKEKNILLFDIGGATTDVYTFYNGKFFRSVSANIGMSYSIVNTLLECGIDNIKKYLTANIKDNEILNYIGHKYLNPTQLPNNKKEELIEVSIAINAINKAIENHFKLYKKEFDEILSQRPWLDIFLQRNKEMEFDIVIGSGGIISNNNVFCRKMIFANINIKHSKSLFDKDFLFPHIGITSDKDKDFAMSLLKNSLHEIDFKGNISQKIFLGNLSHNESLFENNPKVTINIVPEAIGKINKRKVKSGEIIFETSRKVFKKYYISLPVNDDFELIYQTSKKKLKEKDLILSFKKHIYYFKFYAPFDCEIIEINKYQIVISELRTLDEIENYPLAKSRFELKELKKIINQPTKHYKDKLVNGIFYYNDILLSSQVYKRFILSPMTGTITKFNFDDLTISMKRLIERTKITTFASGEITEINDDTIKIKTIGTKVKCKFGFGKSQFATIGKNATFIRNESDFNSFMESSFSIAISFNLPYKKFLILSEKENKSIIIINDFAEFIVSDLFEDIIEKLMKNRIYCSVKTRMKSGVERPFIYYENKNE